MGIKLWEERTVLSSEGFCYHFILLTLKDGGGSYMPTAEDIACNFSQDHARVLKFLDFFKNSVGSRVK